MLTGSNADAPPFKSIPVRLTELAENLFPNSDILLTLLSLGSVDRISDGELEQWLHPTERQQLQDYTHDKRYREWLGGRICAKEGLNRWQQQGKREAVILPANRWQISYQESGGPILQAPVDVQAPLPQLSISHSSGFATALLSRSLCGIDLQQPSEKLQRVREHFCSREEALLLEKNLPDHSFQTQLTLLWAAKEAVKKRVSPLGMPGFRELVLCGISTTDNGGATITLKRSGEDISSPVAAAVLDNGYAMAISCQELATQVSDLG